MWRDTYRFLNSDLLITWELFCRHSVRLTSTFVMHVTDIFETKWSFFSLLQSMIRRAKFWTGVYEWLITDIKLCFSCFIEFLSILWACVVNVGQQKILQIIVFICSKYPHRIVTFDIVILSLFRKEPASSVNLI